MGEESMTYEIQEAIRKGLPAQVADILKKELEELERLRGVDFERETLVKIVNDQKAKLDSLSQKLGWYESREDALVSRELAVEQGVRGLEVTILKVKLEESEKRATIGKELVEAVFRNRTITESTLYDYGQGVGRPGQPVWGSNGYVGPAPAPGQVVKTLEG